MRFFSVLVSADRGVRSLTEPPLLLLLILHIFLSSIRCRPWGATGRLARPAPNATDVIVVIRVSFDLVHGDTRAPLPLEAAYNHHLVIYTRPDKKTLAALAKAEPLIKARAAAAAAAAAQAVEAATADGAGQEEEDAAAAAGVADDDAALTAGVGL